MRWNNFEYGISIKTIENEVCNLNIRTVWKVKLANYDGTLWKMESEIRISFQQIIPSHLQQ